MPWRIKEPNLPGYSAVPSNGNLLPDRKTTRVTDSAVISNNQCRLVGEASRKRKTALTVYQNVVSNDQITAALYPMKKNAGMQAPAVLGAVRFEERFT